jgi:hypothetical protein
MTLVEWLTAILDEDERVARAAFGRTGVWEWQCNHVDYDGNLVHPLQPSHDLCAKLDCDEITIYDEGGHSPEQARHIALHDPAAVLADIAAKRRLLNLCAEWTAMARSTPGSAWYLLGNADKVCRLLASGYAHRDGFDPSWA